MYKQSNLQISGNLFLVTIVLNVIVYGKKDV